MIGYHLNLIGRGCQKKKSKSDMKLNITKSDGTVRYIIDTDIIKISVSFVILFILSFVAVWSLIVPPFLYDVGLSVIVALKLIRFMESRKKVQEQSGVS